MKYILLILLTLVTIIPSIGQEVSKILFSSKGFDEPPTKQGKPELTIEYLKDDLGNFTARYYYKNKKRIKLDTPIVLENERTKTLEEWRKTNLKVFNPANFGLDDEQIKKKATDNNFKTNFALPDNLLIQTDSFNICQNWKMTKTVSTGGYRLRVTINYSTGAQDEFEFGSNDLGMGRFDLKGYIYSYQLISDKIPAQVYQYGFFTKENFLDITLNYFKTIECEGYYYNEFTDKNPKRTPAENRMRTDWDFIEYMKQRSIKE